MSGRLGTPISFDLEPMDAAGIYDDNKVTICKKQCKKCCYISTGVTLLNLLYILGGYSIFYYIYLKEYIDDVDETIQGTILEDKEKTKELLIKLPALVNLLCKEFGC